MSAPQSPSAAEQVLWPDTLQSELPFAKRMARFGVANTATGWGALLYNQTGQSRSVIPT
jgi:hypothetical protein